MACLVFAQEFTSAPNPYQGEFSYTVNSEFTPALEIDGVRWLTLRVAPKNEEDVRSGREVATTILYDLENVSDQAAQGILVLLFEDAQGNSLDRVECDPARVPPDTVKSFRYKTKIQGDVLLATAKLYLFCEVQR